MRYKNTHRISIYTKETWDCLIDWEAYSRVGAVLDLLGLEDMISDEDKRIEIEISIDKVEEELSNLDQSDEYYKKVEFLKSLRDIMIHSDVFFGKLTLFVEVTFSQVFPSGFAKV